MAGMLCTVFLVAMVWYRWQRLHQPLDVVSRSMLFLRTWEKVMRGILAFRPGDFWCGMLDVYSILLGSGMGIYSQWKDIEGH